MKIQFVHIDIFIYSLLIFLVLPLSPLILDYLLISEIRSETLLITAALYSLSIGANTKSRGLTGLGLISGIILMACYGFILRAAESDIVLSYVAVIAILVFFLLHAFERYYRHVMDDEDLFDS